MADLPPFDPSKPFSPVGKSELPAFDPSKPHEVAGAPEKVFYNDAGQPFTLSGRPPPSAAIPSDQSYTGSLLPLRRDASGLHFAMPESVASPFRGAAEAGKRLKGVGEAGKNPLRPLSEDELAAVGTFGALPFRAPSDVNVLASRPAAARAVAAGYVLPPSSISETPGLISKVLSGWGGKIKTQQAASQKNQEVTNRLAAQALGLSEGTTLSDQVFRDVRSKAGQAYRDIIDAIPIIKADAQSAKAVRDLGGANSQAAQLFPKIVKNPAIDEMIGELMSVSEAPTAAAVELVKELRFNANGNLHAIGDPSKHALGIAQRQAADIIDDLMERNLAASGKPDLVEKYREARRIIARSYDIEGATNPATGDVNARGLARLAAKGRPLTGELDTIADAAAAFPKATMAPAGFGYDEAWSALDFFGGAGAALSGHPGVLGAIFGRPLARAAVLSGPAQRSMAAGRMGISAPDIGNVGRLVPGMLASPTGPLQSLYEKGR